MAYEINGTVIDENRQYSESEVRDIVGAPTIEEEQTCTCGKVLESCPQAYEHMSSGY